MLCPLNLNGHKDENDPCRFTYRYLHSLTSSTLFICFTSKNNLYSINIISCESVCVYVTKLIEVWGDHVWGVYVKWHLQWTCEFSSTYNNLSLPTSMFSHAAFCVYLCIRMYQRVTFESFHESERGNEKSHFENLLATTTAAAAAYVRRERTKCGIKLTIFQ